MASGAPVIATCHGTSLSEVANRPAMAALMARRAFHHYALLQPEGGGRIAALYDRAGSPVKA
jgi:stage III sporulation protein SpoIIIAA